MTALSNFVTEEGMAALTRRNLITTGAAGAAAAVFANQTTTAAYAGAQASMELGRQVPFYRSKLGSADITIVSDGTIAFPPSALLPQVPQDELEDYLSAFYQPTDALPLQVNAMVIDLNGRRVLIDAGNGKDKFQPTAGALPENLLEAGIDPATVDTVVFTHLHPDHLWGVTDADNEALIFPNAEYVAAEPERAFWGDPDLPGRMPDEFMRSVAQTTLEHLASIEDRLRTVEATADVSPGITFVPTHGHTPGHVAIMVESDGESLISTGDVIAHPLVNLEQPRWGIGFDWDVEQGIASRLAFLDQAATDRARVFGFHLPWPGFGYIARHRDAYRWIKEEWDWQA
jgi:glyoxylase-like metal-dependent hydrolase (beta-lactamase superfamily II)